MNKEHKIIFIGDSITDCGRERPVSSRQSLGDGYVALINSFLELYHYKKSFKVMNYGIGGETVIDLARRWNIDVLVNAPEYLTVMIGVNDVWRQIDNPFEYDIHVGPGEYQETLRMFIKQSHDQGANIILMTPFLIESNENDVMKTLLRKYITIVKQTAEEFKTGFIDIQAEFDRYLEKSGAYSMFLSHDRVHPGLTGHLIIARAWMDYFESTCLEEK